MAAEAEAARAGEAEQLSKMGAPGVAGRRSATPPVVDAFAFVHRRRVIRGVVLVNLR